MGMCIFGPSCLCAFSLDSCGVSVWVFVEGSVLVVEFVLLKIGLSGKRVWLGTGLIFCMFFAF